jgi:hypothetical protein
MNDWQRRLIMSVASMGLGCMAVAALAVAYYFAVSLPNYNNARLALERQHYADDQKQRERTAADALTKEETRATDLQVCLDGAEKNRMTYLRLNGTITAKGTIQTSDQIARFADDKKKAEVDACFRQFGK